jgi:autonomous glycyl radical cofactor GrcA
VVSVKVDDEFRARVRVIVEVRVRVEVGDRIRVTVRTRETMGQFVLKLPAALQYKLSNLMVKLPYSLAFVEFCRLVAYTRLQTVIKTSLN